MKKSLWLVFLLTLACVLTLSACDKGTDQPSDTDDKEQSTNQSSNNEVCQHNFGNWMTVKTASCKEEGLLIRVCGKCSTSEQTVIEKNNSHNEVVDAAISATCIAEGKTEGKHCSDCGKVIVAQEVIAKNDTHNIVIDSAISATCTTNGKTEGKHCSDCGKVIVPQQLIDAGHTIVTDKAISATCSNSGLTEGSHCSVCGTILVKQESIGMVSHNYVKGKCQMCGEEELYSLGLSYSVNYDEEYVVVTGIGSCTNSTVIIPAYQNGMPVKEIDSYAFYQTNTVKKVIIPETVTKIGYRAFRESKLEEITIPDSVIEIGGDAFYDCYYLTKITIPSTLQDLGTNAFGMCSNANYTYYENAKYLGNDDNPYLILVARVTSSATVRVNDETKFISYNAYIYDSVLKNIYLPKSLVYIDECAFAYCSDLTIHFAGTKQEWNDMRKHRWWADYSSYTIICTDGAI